MMVVESPSWLEGEKDKRTRTSLSARQSLLKEKKNRLGATLTQGPGRRHAQSRPLNTEISGEWIDLGLRLTAPRPASGGIEFTVAVVVLGCILV